MLLRINKNKSFDALISPYVNQIERLAIRLTGNSHEAEDLIQESLIKIFPNKINLDQSAKSKSWVTRIVYNTYVDLWRKQRNDPLENANNYCISDKPDETELFNTHICKTLSPESLHSLSESQRALTRLLFRLSNEHRILLIMHDVEGYTLPELTEIIKVPLGTLKSRLHRGREKLRQLLENETVEEAQYMFKRQYNEM